jgi:hypothetical protein
MHKVLYGLKHNRSIDVVDVENPFDPEDVLAMPV